MSHTFSYISCYCLSYCTDNFFRKIRCAKFTSHLTSITHVFVSWNCLRSSIQCLLMEKQVQKTLEGGPSTSLQGTISAKQFDDEHFLIRCIRRHLITRFRVANGKKQISLWCRTICEIPCNCIQHQRSYTNIKTSDDKKSKLYVSFTVDRLFSSNQNMWCIKSSSA